MEIKQHINNRVAVLDAGGQYVDLVKKAVERQGFPADILTLHATRKVLEAGYGAIIISGSPASSHKAKAPQPDPNIWSSDLPILGICYGMQAMVVAHEGKVAKNAIREDGRITTQIDTTQPLFYGLKKSFRGLFTHGDFVTKVPDGFKAIGQHQLSNGKQAYSAVAKGNKVGVQFHPEVFDDTPGGYQLFRNFLFEVAALKPDKSFQKSRLKEIIKTKRQKIVEQAGSRHVIAFVSGGVDSSVAAALAAKVISPKKFHAYYIDNGFMRYEDDMVIDVLNAAGIAVSKVNAIEKFEQATTQINGRLVGPLVEVTDPEMKRKIIGKTFIDVQNDIIVKLNLSEALLLQGTNAADRIESGKSKSGHTDTIKTHHNQVKEVQDLKTKGLLIEPIDDLFKDEIRALGRALGLPDELVERHPFPGPGLAIRMIAAPKYLQKVAKDPLEDVIQKFISKSSYDTVKPVVCHLLPIKSVGVGGDERSHTSVMALDNADLSVSDMANLAQEIPANFRGKINRVIYALGKNSLVKWTITKTSLADESRDQLRSADKIVFEEMRLFNVLSEIQQMPVILLPVSFYKPGNRSIVLRPVSTSTFMTVQAMLPGKDLPSKFFDSITQRILNEVPGISQVFLDLTNKPPGTTEWE